MGSKGLISIVTFVIIVLMGDASSATDRVALDPYNGIWVYESTEVDNKISGVTDRLAQVATQLDQLRNKTAQDQAQLKTDLQTDLTKQIGQVLTPELLQQIQEAAAAEVTKRVLATLHEQGVLQ